VITALMLVPLTGVLAWIYGYLLPERWRWTLFDLLCLSMALLMGAGWIYWASAHPFAGSGPVYGDLIAAAGAYPIIVTSMAMGLAWRRSRGPQTVAR
jgi:hypothetical protein